jgi:hypothetical protein
MAIYRKIDCRISNDKKFRELSVEGKLAWYTILSRRDLAPIGAFKASFESLAIEQRGNEYLNEGLQKDLPKGFSEVFIQALNELLSKGLIKYDSESFLIYVPNFLKYNFPENPNVVKSWNSALDSLPECDLTNHVLAKSAQIILNSQRDSFIKALPKEFNEAYRKGFAKDLPKGFSKDFGKGMPKQEQEQEQEQETYTRTEKSEEHPEVSKSFAGRVSEKPSFSKTDPTEEELPLLNAEEEKDTQPTVSKTEKVQKGGKVKNDSSALQKPDDVPIDRWNDFIAHRKAIKKPFNSYAFKLMQTECKKAGWTMTEAIERVLAEGWTGFKAEYVKDEWKNPNAVWVTAAEYNKELPPVTYSIGARDMFIEKLHAGMNAFDIKDLPNHKEQK